MKQINVDQDIFDYLVSHASAPGESPGATLRRELKVPPPQATLSIDDDTYAFIVSKTVAIGESVSDILRRELTAFGDGPPAPPPGPSTVVFRIAPGTGARSWNEGSTMVLAKVGDTLRIFNDDAIAHEPHTEGRPFPHPASPIFPGASADYLLQSPYDPNADGPLYDHTQGPSAQFWLRVVAAG